ncbi:glycosyltransferase family 4 protein [Aliivibrio fischeri]|uniref:glycosyltransferase family 4 protein n=1 Tax=Aliivibrio fischeri TaxID=668 RepID=UPI00080D9962|nr:glycosyltransferase family 4 protein [Aliivibrio fischeri]OCH10633.1 hypothetical protein A6E09_11415 [Aliivibrio fischeri]
MLKKINEHNPDILHFHFGYFLNDINCLRNIIKDKKVIISFHGTDLNSIINRNKLLRKSLLEVSALENVTCTFPSHFLAEKYYNMIGRNGLCAVNVIHNSVSDDFFNCWDNKKINKESRVLSVGRLVPVKGFKYVIEAIYELKCNGVNVVYDIIGCGFDLSKLKKIVNEYGLENNVSFLGRLDKSQIIEKIKQSDIYIQPSVKLSNGQEESFGVSALEASVSGIPVIVTNTGGLTETINKKNPNHYLIPEKNVSEISSCILKIINSKKIVHPQKSFFNEFSQENIFKKWIDIYEN